MQKNDFNIRMKKILFPVLILVCNIVLSQTAVPETYSKIKFVYEQKPNFFIENNKLYADTLLFRISFPELKFSKGISPIDSTKTIGFIVIENLSKEDKKRLNGFLYHTAFMIQGTYDVKKNKTKLFYTRPTKPFIENYKKYLGANFPKVNYNVVIDYKNREIYKNYFYINKVAPLDSQLITLTFTNEDKSIGTYTFQTKNGFETDIVILNNKHNNKITSDEVFSNNDYAIDKIVTLYDTTTLLSVVYE
jgi:hypothetical protein